MTEISNADFGMDFKWGVSTAAYQVEGAFDADGKGPSIWDVFTQGKRNISNNQNGNIACDFYKRYPDDIALLDKLNINNYRFSIAWSRIFPMGTGIVNQHGIDYYNKLIDHCLQLGIVPWITLYHWDLPQALQEKGGWTNRQIVDWFKDFVVCCIQNFGDRVKNWMVLNEPMVFTGAGYFLGVHAPGKKGLANFLSAAHHAALCQAEGGRVIKYLRSDCKVGTTFSYSHIEPYRNIEKDRIACIKVDALLNRLFLEPLLGMGYPVNDFKILNKMERYIQDGDEAKLAFDMDFIGLQVYTREIVKHAAFMPFIKAKIIKADKRQVDYTLMNWEIHPPAIFKALEKMGGYKKIKEIVVTENGAAFEDEVKQGIVNDYKRLKYLKEHIKQVLLAKNCGVNVTGYFVWTLLDNFEWAEGFHPRFGLVHVDFESQQRIIKASGHWYGSFIKASESAKE